jgi:tetratricopeptide (TPR) repeat protein
MLFVLGMHRSGTSCLTGLLEDGGFSIGTPPSWRWDNLKGNRESEAVNDLNDEVLAEAGGRWDRPVLVRPPFAPTLCARRAELLSTLQSFAPGRPLALKDPRIVLTHSFWAEAEPQAARVGIFRHPWAVASSVATRDMGQSLADGLRLWITYNQRLVGLQQEYGFALLCFDLPRLAFIEATQKAVAQAVADGVAQGRIQPEAIGPFYTQDMVHQTRLPPSRNLLDAEVRTLLRQADKLYEQLLSVAGVDAQALDSAGPVPGARGTRKAHASSAGAPASPANAAPTPPVDAAVTLALAQADAARDRGEWHAALATYERLLQLASLRPAIWRRWIKLLRLRQSPPEELHAALVRAVGDCPDDAELSLQLSQSALQQRDLPLAERALSVALRLRPDAAGVQLQAGNLALERSDWASAREHLEQALELQPESAWTRVLLMRACMGLGDESSALAHLEAAQTRLSAEQQPDMQHVRAQSLAEANRLSEALPWWDRAIGWPAARRYVFESYASALERTGLSQVAMAVRLMGSGRPLA